MTVEKTFGANDASAYRDAETVAYKLLSHCKATHPGTTWGTDSASVGGHVGLTSGRMTLNRSGVSPAFAQELTKALGVKPALR